MVSLRQSFCGSEVSPDFPKHGRVPVLVQGESSLFELEYMAHVVYILLAAKSECLAGFELSESSASRCHVDPVSDRQSFRLRSQIRC